MYGEPVKFFNFKHWYDAFFFIDLFAEEGGVLLSLRGFIKWDFARVLRGELR